VVVAAVAVKPKSAMTGWIMIRTVKSIVRIIETVAVILFASNFKEESF
jgi:hypothetical protein